VIDNNINTITNTTDLFGTVVCPLNKGKHQRKNMIGTTDVDTRKTTIGLSKNCFKINAGITTVNAKGA